VEFRIDVNQRLVVCTFSGDNSEEEIIGLASRIRSHHDFDPSFSEIVDCSGVSPNRLSTAAIERISRRPSIFSPTSTHVIVAPQDHIFGLVRMAQALADRIVPNVVVVRTMDEARQVLKLEKSGTD
jgi:hypothetical protein